MIGLGLQLAKFLVWLWPLWLWLLAWNWGGELVLGTVFYRTGQVAASAALLVPATLLAARGIGPPWIALLAAIGAIAAGYSGLASEWQRVGPFAMAPGQNIAAVLPYLDYPLLAVSVAAILGPSLVPALRWLAYRRSATAKGTLLGSARWMSLREARQVFQNGDLVIGEAYDAVRDPRAGGSAPLLRHRPNGHLLTVAGSGSGKTTSIAIPNCLSWPETLVAHDPKGELARLCGPSRSKRGRSVFVLDPLDPQTDSLNVLSWLDPTSERLIDDARAMVSWLTDGKPPEGENKIFEENARELIMTLLLVVVCDDRWPASERTLERLRRYFYQEDLRGMLADLAAHGDHLAFGVPAANARVFQGFGERLWGSVLGSAKDLLNCISGPPMARLVSGGGGKVLTRDDLAGGKTDVFISIPVKDLDANPAIARLLLGTLLNAAYEIGQGNAGQRNAGKARTLFLLDEMPRLRYMGLLETARDVGRGHGLTLWAIVQDLGQLEKHYQKEGLVSWLENSEVKSFFGIGEYSTAERLSQTIGETTITSRSRSFEHPFELVSGKSDSPTARALITPDEIMRMAVDARGLPDEQIVLLRNQAPLRCGLAKYYRRKEFAGETGDTKG
ncbi:type IV secretory system conjugative DNA transfer family protein [Jiella sonneratiae]|uniref:Type IV secretory system conjugative DNA transfer family protein n=1 Tax=Jiella sonneratiae TaxID=2816856 RepID=A0ABS3JCI0_9HYPH|nr:type IV secretory system conjugative DNA transfer family protein [Jiella sonneratiae]MBO0906281.1 type IV secretory system conjugative DNA transfer family protein [Jiella sonneratiae]